MALIVQLQTNGGDMANFYANYEKLQVLNYYIWFAVDGIFSRRAFNFTFLANATYSLLFQIDEEELDLLVADSLFDARCEVLLECAEALFLGDESEIALYEAFCSSGDSTDDEADVRLFVETPYLNRKAVVMFRRAFLIFVRSAHTAARVIVGINKRWKQDRFKDSEEWRLYALAILSHAYLFTRAIAKPRADWTREKVYGPHSASVQSTVKAAALSLVALSFSRRFYATRPWRENVPAEATLFASRVLTDVTAGVGALPFANLTNVMKRKKQRLLDIFDAVAGRLYTIAPQTMAFMIHDRVKDADRSSYLSKLETFKRLSAKENERVKNLSCCASHVVLAGLALADLLFHMGITIELHGGKSNDGGKHLKVATEFYAKGDDLSGEIAARIHLLRSLVHEVAPVLNERDEHRRLAAYADGQECYAQLTILSTSSTDMKYPVVQLAGILADYFSTVSTDVFCPDAKDIAKKVTRFRSCIHRCKALCPGESFHTKSMAQYVCGRYEFERGEIGEGRKLFEEAIRGKRLEEDVEACHRMLVEYDILLLKNGFQREAVDIFQAYRVERDKMDSLGCEAEQLTGICVSGQLEGDTARVLVQAYWDVHGADIALAVFDSLKASFLAQKLQARSTPAVTDVQHDSSEMLANIRRTCRAVGCIFVVFCECLDYEVTRSYADANCILVWTVHPHTQPIESFRFQMNPTDEKALTASVGKPREVDDVETRGFPERLASRPAAKISEFLSSIFDRLAGSDHSDNVAIVADGKCLLDVDFLLLPLPNRRCRLMRHFEVSFYPSIAALRAGLLSGTRSITPTICVVANPTLHAGIESYLKLDGKLANLEKADEEAAELEKLCMEWSLPVTILRGSAASKKNLKAILANVVHFAAHAIANVMTIEESHIAGGVLLSPNNEAVHPGATVLDVADVKEGIFSTDSRIDLAFLHCCESGRGVVGGTEGLLGLGRALLYAGCQVVVVCSVPVFDSPLTVQFTRLFYESYFTNRCASTALKFAIDQLCEAGHSEENFRGYMVLGV